MTYARTRSRRARRHSPLLFYAFASPWALGFLLLTAGPLAYSLWLSFQTYDGLTARSRFVGLDNYRNLIGDPKVTDALGRTAMFTLIVVPAVVIAALLLAVMLNQRRKGVTLFRALIFLPAVIPVVASALMFKLMFDRDRGLVNAILGRVGIDRLFWLSGDTARFVLIAMSLWSLGGGMLIFLAALQDVPTELIEASTLDGAGSIRRFLSITVPLVSPTIFFQVVVNMIFASQILIEPILISPASQINSGGLLGASTVPEVNRLYLVEVGNQLFSFSRFGYAAAMLWVLLAVLLSATVLLLRLSRRLVFYAGVERGDL